MYFISKTTKTQILITAAPPSLPSSTKTTNTIKQKQTTALKSENSIDQQESQEARRLY